MRGGRVPVLHAQGARLTNRRMLATDCLYRSRAPDDVYVQTNGQSRAINELTNHDAKDDLLILIYHLDDDDIW